MGKERDVYEGAFIAFDNWGRDGWRCLNSCPEQIGSRTPSEAQESDLGLGRGRSGLLLWGIQQKDKRKILQRIFKA